MGSKPFVFRASCFGYFGYHTKGCLSVAPFSTLLGYLAKNTAKFKVFLTTESLYLDKLTKIHAIFVLAIFFQTCLRLLEHCVKGQTALCLGNLGLFFAKISIVASAGQTPINIAHIQDKGKD